MCRSGSGALLRDQPDAQKPVTMLLQTVQQVGVLLQLGAADLHQYRLPDPVGLHGGHQFLDRLFPVGGAVRIDLARKPWRRLGEDVDVGVDAQHHCSRLNSRRRSEAVQRCAMEEKVPASTRPAVLFS